MYALVWYIVYRTINDSATGYYVVHRTTKPAKEFYNDVESLLLSIHFLDDGSPLNGTPPELMAWRTSTRYDLRWSIHTDYVMNRALFPPGFVYYIQNLDSKQTAPTHGHAIRLLRQRVPLISLYSPFIGNMSTTTTITCKVHPRNPCDFIFTTRPFSVSNIMYMRITDNYTTFIHSDGNGFFFC